VLEDPTVAKIQKTLVDLNDELQLHEGAVGLVGFKEGVVYLELGGGCASCPASMCGVIANLENKIKTAVPEVKKVIIL